MSELPRSSNTRAIAGKPETTTLTLEELEPSIQDIHEKTCQIIPLIHQVVRERLIQGKLWGLKDKNHSAAEWIAIICRHAGMGIDDGGTDPQDRFNRQIMRVAAIAFAALELRMMKDLTIKTDKGY